MVRFTARMVHSKATICRLIETQDKTFNFGKTLFLYLLSFVLIIYGLYADKKMFTPWIALFAGCFLVGNSGISRKAKEKRVLAQINGDYPVSDYSFEDSVFTYCEGEPIVPYSSVIRLVEDKQYMYIYVSETGAYMVDKTTVSPGDSEELKKHLSAETGLSWVKTNSLLSTNLWDILKEFRKK